MVFKISFIQASRWFKGTEGADNYTILGTRNVEGNIRGKKVVLKEIFVNIDSKKEMNF